VAGGAGWVAQPATANAGTNTSGAGGLVESLRICGAAQTHLQNFLCEERGNSFADSDPYCGWRSTLIIEVMQLD
jgi:hypothetical protein